MWGKSVPVRWSANLAEIVQEPRSTIHKRPQKIRLPRTIRTEHEREGCQVNFGDTLTKAGALQAAKYSWSRSALGTLAAFDRGIAET